jgi:hypothetical protein
MGMFENEADISREVGMGRKGKKKGKVKDYIHTKENDC